MKKKVFSIIFILLLNITIFHIFTLFSVKYVKTIVTKDEKSEGNVSTVKITYKAGSGTGSNYVTTVTPTTKNYAKNVATLIKNKGVTNYTHADVTKTISSNNYTYHMILTGWKLVSVKQNGTTITTYREPEKYNYADRTNAAKDIGTIYSEEGYYYVPDYVTEVTFEAVYGWAIYVKNPYTTMKYDKNYWFDTDSSIATGRTGSADSNFGTNDSTDVIASFQRAYDLIRLSGETTDAYTMYDHVIVMMGDITDVRATQGSQPTSCHTDTYNGKTISNCNSTNTNWGYTNVHIPVTITSNPNGTTRYIIRTKAQTWGYNLYGDLRLDFVNWRACDTVSGGVSKSNPSIYMNRNGYYNAIETTERFTSNYQLNYELRNAVKTARMMGGNISLRYTAHPFGGTIDVSNFKYVIIGGTVSDLYYSNTAGSEISTSVGTINNPPTLNILGGRAGNIFLAGNSSPSTLAFTRSDKTVYLFATGGSFGNVYGSGASSLNGNAYMDFKNVTITGIIYGGGNNARSKISGNVTINVENSTAVNLYGGPQYGDIMGTAKLTIKNSTLSGNVYGAGYGATSSTNVRLGGQGTTAVATVLSALQSGTSANNCSSDGLTCYDSNGTELPNIKKISNQFRWYAISAKANELVGADMRTKIGFIDSTYEQLTTRFYFGNSTEQTNVTHYPYQSISSLSAASVQNVDLTIEGSTVDGNVYAGGDRGSVTGDASLIIKNSTIKGNVYGGGYTVSNNTVAVYYKNYCLLNRSYVYLNSSGNIAHAGENTNYYPNCGSSASGVRNENFTWKNYSYLLTNSASWTASNKSDYESYWGSGSSTSATVINGIDYVNKVIYSNTANKMGTIYGNSTITINNSNLQKNLYGGGYAGISNGNINISITNNSTISGHVYAGAYSSSVGGKSTITLANGSTITGNIYGGGEGETSTVVDSELNISGRVNGSIYGGSYAGKVTGSTIIKLNSGGVVANDLYAGGYGATSVSNNVTTTITGTVTKSYYGGSYAGKVNGTSTLNLNSGGVVTTNLYGGGYGDTSTLNSSVININGQAKANVYGGSYAGSVTSSSITVGSTGVVTTNIYGAGEGSTSTVASNSVTVAGRVNGSVYGGSYAGKVTGTTTIAVNTGGVIANDLYGGGYGSSSQSNNVTTTVTGTVTKSYYGGSYAGKVTGTATLNLNSGGVITTNIYGGGYGDTSILGSSVINVNGQAKASVYGGSYAGKVTNTSSITIGTTGSVEKNIFGAGEGASSNIKSTTVTVKGTVKKDVYGGSDLGTVGVGVIDGVNNTANITTLGSTTVNIQTGANILGSVYGAGNGAPEGESSMHIEYGALFGPTNVNVTGGSISGNLYGGGNRSRVFVSTGNAVSMTVNGTSNAIQITGALFGGGNSAGDSGVNASVPTVIGNTNVIITDSTSADNIKILGGIYGGGNLCLVKGTKSVQINNFGTQSEEAIKTLQRADSVVLNNSNIHVDSARDVVNEFDTSEYSINRIGNLQFTNGSKVTINKTVNFLNNITSDVTTNSNVNNYLYINNGLLTKIEKEDNSYGLVTGYFKLGLINYASGEGGGFLFANENSTGNFISADGTQNIVNRVYTNNYKYWYLEGNSYDYSLKVTGYTKAINSYVVELPLLQLHGKAFNLSLQSSSYSNTFRTYLTNNPYVDVVVGYKTGSASALNVTSPKNIYNETSASTATLPTLLLELNVNSLNLENTISGEVVNMVLSDGTDTYNIALEINIVDQVIGNSVFTNSGKWFNGVSLNDNINVSNDSSYTVQFLTTYVPRLYSDMIMTLETTTKFYTGTKIIIVDTTDENVINYYYYIVTSDTKKINLTQFKKMGTTNVYFEPYFSNKSINENLTVIIDMQDSSTLAGTGTIMLGHYSNNIEILGNTSSSSYIVATNHPSMQATLTGFGNDYYNFNYKVTNSSNTATDTLSTSQYLLEVKHKDNSTFGVGSYVMVGSNSYVPTADSKSIILPISTGTSQLKYVSNISEVSKNLTFNLYHGTSGKKSSGVISTINYTVPTQLTYSFGILKTMNRVIDLNATQISVPITYSDLSGTTVTAQLQSKTINSNGTYTYTTLKDYLKNDDSNGKVTVTLSNTVNLQLESNKLESMKTYNVLFTVTKSNGFTFTDNVEIVVK